MNFTYRLSQFEERASLIVGPRKIPIKCHRALFGYYSGFFDGALYGGFTEGSKSEMNLPEDLESHVRAFVQWTYTGHVFESFAEPAVVPHSDMFDLSGVAAEELWIFANKILAPKFANDIMHFILMKYNLEDQYHQPPLGANAKYVFDEAPVGSKLRDFMTKFLQAKRPFSNQVYTPPQGFHEGWLTILSEGGDFVRECVVEDALSGFDEDEPWREENRLKYMQDEGKVTAADWCKKKNHRGDPAERC
jgi:hypothetical protein